MIEDFLVGVAASTVVGIVLWLLLPRGVVLTRLKRASDWCGQPISDTWVLRNDSAVAGRLLRVQVTNSSMYDDTRGRFVPQILQDDVAASTGVRMFLDDQIGELTREETFAGRWTGVVVEPGDTIQVTVPNNTDVRVDYRRDGWTGVLERRHVRVRGGV
ncbi:hypothetical protein [Phycicoccus avicenniae]|uniref:hypothetical protein n=1 Tax=Phycicoccus avicenniae TaxID=2828860 RepID=UPI003D26B0DC